MSYKVLLGKLRKHLYGGGGASFLGGMIRRDMTIFFFKKHILVGGQGDVF